MELDIRPGYKWPWQPPRPPKSRSIPCPANCASASSPLLPPRWSASPPWRPTSPAPVPASSTPCCPSGRRRTPRRPATTSTTSPSVRAAASPRSRPAPSTSALPTSRWTSRTWPSSGLGQFPIVIGGIVPALQRAGHRDRQAGAGRPDPGQHLPGQDHQVERSGHRQAEPGHEPAVDCASPSCIAPTVRAPPSTSPTTCPRSAPSGRARSVKARRSSGRPASAARATRACRPTSSRSRARSATSSTPTR